MLLGSIPTYSKTTFLLPQNPMHNFRKNVQEFLLGLHERKKKNNLTSKAWDMMMICLPKESVGLGLPRLSDWYQQSLHSQVGMGYFEEKITLIWCVQALNHKYLKGRILVNAQRSFQASWIWKSIYIYIYSDLENHKPRRASHLEIQDPNKRFRVANMHLIINCPIASLEFTFHESQLIRMKWDGWSSHSHKWTTQSSQSPSFLLD